MIDSRTSSLIGHVLTVETYIAVWMRVSAER